MCALALLPFPQSGGRSRSLQRRQGCSGRLFVVAAEFRVPAGTGVSCAGASGLCPISCSCREARRWRRAASWCREVGVESRWPASRAAHRWWWPLVSEFESRALCMSPPTALPVGERVAGHVSERPWVCPATKPRTHSHELVGTTFRCLKAVQPESLSRSNPYRSPAPPWLMSSIPRSSGRGVSGCFGKLVVGVASCGWSAFACRKVMANECDVSPCLILYELAVSWCSVKRWPSCVFVIFHSLVTVGEMMCVPRGPVDLWCWLCSGMAGTLRSSGARALTSKLADLMLASTYPVRWISVVQCQFA